MHARNLGVVFGREYLNLPREVSYSNHPTTRQSATLMRSRDPNAEFSDMAGKALCVEWLVENAPSIFERSNSPLT